MVLVKLTKYPAQLKKAIKNGEKNLIKVQIVRSTISHAITGKFGAGKVLLMPAQKGRGIIAGGPVRSVVELAGLQNIYAKSLGSSAPINVIRATLNGLENLKSKKEIDYLRASHAPVKTEPVQKNPKSGLTVLTPISNKEIESNKITKEKNDLNLKEKEIKNESS